MKNILIYLIIGLFTVVVNAQTELNNYLKIAAQNNPYLKATFASYHASLQKIPQVGTLPDPKVSFGYFISPIETRVGPQKAKLGFSQMFPWFGTLNAKKDVATQNAKAKYEAFEEAKSKLFFDVKSTYYTIYFLQKGINISKENLRILATFQQLAIIKIETGKASVVDEMRVEMEINELTNQLAYLMDSKATVEIKFNNLLNNKEPKTVLIPDTLWNDSLTISKDDLLNNHLIKQLGHKVLSWEKQKITAKKMGNPQFSIGVDYAIIGKSSNPNLGNENGRDALLLPKIGVSIPLYRKKYTAMIKEASFRIEEFQYTKENKQNELVSLFEKNLKDYKDAQRRIILYQKQLVLAQKSLNILLTAYSTDGKNFEEILRMERNVLKYALELDKARTDKNTSVAFINYLTGK